MCYNSELPSRNTRLNSRLVLFYNRIITYLLGFTGLLDPGETVQVAAVRELQEETGYTGKLVDITQTVPYEPGLSNSCTRFVEIKVDTETRPRPNREASEWSLQTVLIRLDETALDQLKAFGDKDILVDSRLFCYIKGMADALDLQ